MASAVLLGALTLQATASLVAAHRMLSGRRASCPACVVLAVEFVKLAFNLAMYTAAVRRERGSLASAKGKECGQDTGKTDISPTKNIVDGAKDATQKGRRHTSGHMVGLALAALLFAVQNNASYYALARLPPALFQVLQQLRIPWTALFSVLYTGRRISPRQWLAVAMLAVGVAIVQLSTLDSRAGLAVDLGSVHARAVGVMLAITLSSAFAGVHLERVLKAPASASGAWAQAVQLSIFGVAFSLAGAIISVCGVSLSSPMTALRMPFGPGPRGVDLTQIVSFSQRLLPEMNMATGTVVCLHALGGTLVALVTRRTDSIRKAFATSASVVVYALFCATDGTYSTAVLAGSFVVAAAIIIYASSAPKPADPVKPPLVR